MTRRIENSIEVPGTPEEVWEAIATSHGIECWFVPAQVQDGRVALDMGGGMEDAGPVVASEPPRRFVYEEVWEAVEGEPPGGSRRSSSSRPRPAAPASSGSSAPSTPTARAGTRCWTHVPGLGDVPAQPARLPHALPGPALRHGHGLGDGRVAGAGGRSRPGRGRGRRPRAPPTRRCSRARSSTAASASCCSAWTSPRPAWDWSTPTTGRAPRARSSTSICSRARPRWPRERRRRGATWMAVPSAR